MLNFSLKWKSYFSGVVVYGLGVVLVQSLSYYQKALSPMTHPTLFWLFGAYLFLGPWYYLFLNKDEEESKPLLLLKGIQNLFLRGKIEPAEKIAVLFMAVKIFFLPTMISFLYNNMGSLWGLQFSQTYPWVITSLFTVDTFIFTLGYLFEFPSWKNKVISVESTLLGWAVALISYPPFNSIVGSYVPWGADDYVFFWNSALTALFRTMIILLLAIYVWASVALGTKASNLTNRGIVTKFPYSIVRHPAYISKNLLWWITLLPVMNWKFAVGMSFWTAIYYLRAYTEERHLSHDSEYREYCQNVKWRFIPWLL